jgi:hypothetical protein
VLYLYAIIDPVREPLVLPPGLEDAKACVVPFDGLAAVVSALDRPPGHETREVCRHMDVLSALIERHTVLPVRFGTVFPSREDLERSIADAREVLTADLRRLSGQIEFGITVTGQELPAPQEEPPQAGGGEQGPGALYLAAKRGFVVESYRDEAIGVMEKNDAGRLAMTRVTLRPEIRYAGDKRPGTEEESELHHGAHDECFIANSVRTDVRCEPLGARP